jgi:hypothetical protein
MSSKKKWKLAGMLFVIPAEAGIHLRQALPENGFRLSPE